MTETRKLAAILAADVAGYSGLTGADEEGTLARIRALRSELIDPAISANRGRVANTAGDSILVEFVSVVDAVRAAVDIQRAMTIRNADFMPEKRIEFRIGIHLGDVMVERDGDLRGDGMNIAARLEGIAEPGGICVSDDAHRQARGKIDVTSEDMGPQSLKNIVEPMRVWRLRIDGHPAAPATSQVGTAQPLALPDKPSIAVLPFQNMSGDPEQEYFTDGMVEEIITALARIRSLFVIARNSTFTYKGRAVDVKQVGRELGVRYVLEGSVRKGGNRLRISAQLIEAETGAHLWADRFDGSLEDVFELQDQVALSVAGVIEPALQAAEIRRATARPTSDLTAYDLYLRSIELARAWSREANLRALDLLEQAIERDPRYGLALARAAFCHSQIVFSGWAEDPEPIRHQSIELARRALQVAGDDPIVIALAAGALANSDEDIEPLVGLIDRSLALNPGSAFGWMWSGWIRVFAGDPNRAVEHFKTALRLDPRSPARAFCLTGIGSAHFSAHRLDAAASALQESLQLLPSYVTTYYFLASCLAHMGRHEEARDIVQRLRSFAGRLIPKDRILRNAEQREFFLSGLRLATDTNLPPRHAAMTDSRK